MIVEVPFKELQRLLKAKASLEQVSDALAMFGTPIDDLQGDLLRVEVEPNRVDMLSPEGIARSLNGFLEAETGYHGKNEAWVILDAKPDAFLYYHLDHPVSREEFRRAVEAETVTASLNERRVARVKPRAVRRFFVRGSGRVDCPRAAGGLAGAAPGTSCLPLRGDAS